MSGVTTLRVGDHIRYREEVWQVISVDTRTVNLRNAHDMCTVLTSSLLMDPTLEVASPGGDGTSKADNATFPGHWSTTSASGVLTAAGIRALEQETILLRVELV